MIDTHCHLGLCDADDAVLVADARRVGVRRMLSVGIDDAGGAEAIAAAAAHEEVRACVGRHPNGAAGFDDDDAARIERMAADPGVAAIGETGLDYYRDRAPRDDQRRAFRAQIAIARDIGKPLVIHVRDSGQVSDGEALAEAFEILGAEATGVTVVLHCFSAPARRAAEAAEAGWYCSFAGNLTYPKAEPLREAAAAVPAELLLVETDAPFLSPQPARGKPNEPANVVATAERLAEVRGVSYTELEAAVEANAARVFGW
jgi:TatD DNase family protein